MGTWMMACLLLAASPPPADVTPMNQRAFDIPIRIEPARKAEIRELRLFVSTDQGQSWQMAAAVTPEQPAFNYQAPSDGIYWFSIIVVDQENKQDPPDPMQAAADQKVQKVLVDTLPPQLRIVAAERKGEDVLVRWDANDAHLDLNSLKLLFRPADAAAGDWVPVSFSPAASGQASFRPGGSGPVKVRMEVQDLAQNPPAVAQADVPAAAGGNTSGYAPSAPSGRSDASWAPIQPPSPIVLQNPPREPLDRSPGGVGPGTGGNLIASSQSAPPAGQPAPAAPAPRPPRDPVAPLQIVNSNRVTLEYEVTKFGPSGVGSVELYVTRDEGRTWHPAAGEKNIAAPQPSELQGAAPTMRRSLTVELPDDGTYGFILVVRSGAGRGKPPPEKGDPPQMRVEVDRQAPEARLYAPEPAAGRRDALVLRWVAQDKNLAANPITLQWARQPNGPWETIDRADLPNTGQLVWQVSPGTPPRVFLRLVVRDAAGNTGEAETPEPVLIDLTEPEAHIFKVGSGPR